MRGHSSLLSLAILFLLAFVHDLSAETVAQTVRKWGLIGPWSADCSLPPDRGKGAVLDYEVERDGRVVMRRNFGDGADESEVVSADVSGDGMLNLRAYFPSLKQTRESGIAMQPDGSIRAIYNRNQKNEYTIKDGKFTANGTLTAPLHRCIAANSASSSPAKAGDPVSQRQSRPAAACWIPRFRGV